MLKSNPFKKSDPYRMWQVYKLLPDERVDKLLDFGCGDAYFLSKVEHKAKKLHGCDPLKNLIKENKRKHKSMYFKTISPQNKLPYKDNFFNVVVALEVIEHVDNEKKIVKEFGRIIKPGGTIIITVPNNGIFDFLDRGNLKFNFPRLHKFLYSKIFGKQRYIKDFCSNPEMYGDVTRSEEMYHKHYRLRDLREILEDRFVIDEVVYYSLFAPFIIIMMQILQWIMDREILMFRKLLYIDAKLFQYSFSYGIIVRAKAK